MGRLSESCLSDSCLSVSDAWEIGEINSNLTWTLIRLIYRHCCTVQKIVINEKYIDDENEEILIRLEKLTVDDV